MLLMQKYTLNNGSVGVEDLQRWPLDSDAALFLAMTTSAALLDDLMEHQLLRCKWRKQDLKGMVSLAQVAARRFYKI